MYHKINSMNLLYYMLDRMDMIKHEYTYCYVEKTIYKNLNIYRK